VRAEYTVAAGLKHNPQNQCLAMSFIKSLYKAQNNQGQLVSFLLCLVSLVLSFIYKTHNLLQFLQPDFFFSHRSITCNYSAYLQTH